MKPHYCVYRSDQNRGPKVKHSSLQSAQSEAERLCNQHPGSSFEILECVAITRATAAKTFFTKPNSNEEPKYRELTEGEQILEGDEFLDDDQIWKIRIPHFTEFLNPRYHTPHRRKL